MGQELFALLGERWNYAILRQVFFGVERFGTLQRALDIAPRTLTARLTTLVELGLLERHQYRADKEWFDYRLTAAARELVPAWITMSQWASTHLDHERTAQRRLRHKLCGQIAVPVLTCSHCGEEMSGRDLEPVELSTESEDVLRPDGP
ncbi:winged helix-turn-helix transcriptional regulator [Catenulispora pinisilvae]|uniref:winged helix-turn-helix transcriptional regulator n=1 Tax=Catenulispora pinisilvae TaxID=2705253 RepID=UPI0018923EDA|nr:helix-turn-helix domain-containing protein [Catenulispora pinisilvae]